MRHLPRLILLLSFAVAALPVFADDLMMVRTKLDFPEAMLKLQGLIKDRGYEISRVQRVDIGLTKSGYKTDKYRVVFYGTADEVERISQEFPDMVAYLPLKIAIFAEDVETLLVTINPNILFASSDNRLKKILSRWETDLNYIMDNMRKAGY